SRAWLLASMTPARSTTYWLGCAGRGGVTAQARVGQAQNNRIIRSFLELGDLNAIHRLRQSFRGPIKVLEQPGDFLFGWFAQILLDGVDLCKDLDFHAG